MFTQVAWYGKTPPLWKFNLVWHVHKGKTISKFRSPVGFQIGLACPQVQDDNRSGLWDSKLICPVHKGRMISNFPSPWNFKLFFGMSTKVRWYHGSQPMEIENDLGCSQGKGDFKLPNPMELQNTSNWLGMPTMEFQIDMGCPQGYDDIKFSTVLELQTDLECSKGWNISKFLPRWDFKLAWHVHKGKMVSKFYTHGISN
jgi:hypothetical protein